LESNRKIVPTKVVVFGLEYSMIYSQDMIVYLKLFITMFYKNG